MVPTVFAGQKANQFKLIADSNENEKKWKCYKENYDDVNIWVHDKDGVVEWYTVCMKMVRTSVSVMQPMNKMYTVEPLY
jgi:hypothetical protein